jgi:hypothetical protein
MLVTFRTKAHADIMMFGDIAVHLLKLMGHSGTVPSALVADDVPAALNRLKNAMKAHKTEALEAVDTTDEAEDNDDAKERPIDLAHRAFPLIELLEAAAAAHCDVMWDS